MSRPAVPNGMCVRVGESAPLQRGDLLVPKYVCSPPRRRCRLQERSNEAHNPQGNRGRRTVSDMGQRHTDALPPDPPSTAPRTRREQAGAAIRTLERTGALGPLGFIEVATVLWTRLPLPVGRWPPTRSLSNASNPSLLQPRPQRGHCRAHRPDARRPWPGAWVLLSCSCFCCLLVERNRGVDQLPPKCCKASF